MLFYCKSVLEYIDQINFRFSGLSKPATICWTASSCCAFSSIFLFLHTAIRVSNEILSAFFMVRTSNALI